MVPLLQTEALAAKAAALKSRQAARQAGAKGGRKVGGRTFAQVAAGLKATPGRAFAPTVFTTASADFNFAGKAKTPRKPATIPRTPKLAKKAPPSAAKAAAPIVEFTADAFEFSPTTVEAEAAAKPLADFNAFRSGTPVAARTVRTPKGLTPVQKLHPSMLKAPTPARSALKRLQTAASPRKPATPAGAVAALKPVLVSPPSDQLPSGPPCLLLNPLCLRMPIARLRADAGGPEAADAEGRERGAAPPPAQRRLARRPPRQAPDLSRQARPSPQSPSPSCASFSEAH